MILNEETESTLASVIKKVGKLKEPVTFYAPLEGGMAVLMREAWEGNNEKKTVKFPGIVSGSMDPDIAFDTDATAMVQIDAVTGLRVPGDEMIVLQYDKEYEITNYVRTPGPDNGPRIEIFYLKEV